MERFLFIVDERLPLELVAEVLRLRDDVDKIYQRPVEFANLLTKLPVKVAISPKKERSFARQNMAFREMPSRYLRQPKSCSVSVISISFS